MVIKGPVVSRGLPVLDGEWSMTWEQARVQWEAAIRPLLERWTGSLSFRPDLCRRVRKVKMEVAAVNY